MYHISLGVCDERAEECERAFEHPLNSTFASDGRLYGTMSSFVSSKRKKWDQKGIAGESYHLPLYIIYIKYIIYIICIILMTINRVSGDCEERGRERKRT